MTIEQLERTVLSLILFIRQEDYESADNIIGNLGKPDLTNLACLLTGELAKHYPKCNDCIQQTIYRRASEAGS